MSNPNTNALVSILRNSATTPSATAAGFKTVYVGQDRLPVIILNISPLTDPTWKRSACFDSLAHGMTSHLEDFTVSDLTTVVVIELHIDTTTAFVGACSIKDIIMRETCNVSNLAGIAFLKGNGTIADAPKSLDLKDRTEDLSFIRVSCILEGSVIDGRIKQSPYRTQFCLKLPQSSYDSGTKIITSIDARTATATSVPTSTATTPGTNFLNAFTVVGTPSTASASTSSTTVGTPTGTSGGAALCTTTPQMDKLLNLSGGSSTTTISYYGEMTFLDNQNSFDLTFGRNPVFFPYNANKADEGDVRKKILEYAGKCMFDTFWTSVSKIMLERSAVMRLPN